MDGQKRVQRTFSAHPNLLVVRFMKSSLLMSGVILAEVFLIDAGPYCEPTILSKCRKASPAAASSSDDDPLCPVVREWGRIVELKGMMSFIAKAGVSFSEARSARRTHQKRFQVGETSCSVVHEWASSRRRGRR